MGEFIGWVDLLPNSATYLMLGLGVAAENIVPVIPADTFVAVGNSGTVITSADGTNWTKMKSRT